jgi:hypothetical protein
VAHLLQIENRHACEPPEISDQGYRGYFENMLGEQLVFQQSRAEPHAWLWHGDVEFEARKVVRGQAADLILDLGERMWLLACWQESAFLRVGQLAEKDTQQTAEEIAIAVIAPAEVIAANPLFAEALISEIKKRMQSPTA